MTTTTHTSLIGYDARAEVAAAVRSFIGRSGASNIAVAAACGFSQSGFSRRTTGDITFNVDELAILANYFGVSLIDLIAGRAEIIPPNAKKAPRAKTRKAISCTPRDLNPEPTDYGTAMKPSSRPRNRADKSGPRNRAA